MAHEDVGADYWETYNNQCSDVHQPQTGSVKSSQANVKDGGEGRHKGAHQGKDALGASGLRRGSGGDTVAMSVLDLLLVPVQDGNHGGTSLDHEPQTENIMEQYQCYIQ